MKTNTLLAISKLSEVFNLDDQKKKKKSKEKQVDPNPFHVTIQNYRKF